MNLNQKNQQSASSALNPHIRIVIASGIYPPDIGGPATYSQLIAREFSKRGIGVAVICYSDEKQETRNKMQDFLIVRILRRYNKLIRYWFYFWNLLKIAKKTDIIYAQGPLAAGLPAMLVNRILGRKFFIKIVGDYAWEQGVNQFGVKDLIGPFQNKKYNWKVELIRKVQKIVVRNANKVIVPSEFLKRVITGWGVDRDKVEVIYNAIDDRRYTQIVSEQSSEHADTLGNSAFISVLPKVPDQRVSADTIISAGRLEPWKGMGALVDIMPELLKENSDFRLIIIGRGPEGGNLKSQISNLKLEREIKLIDKLPQQELLKYFKASKLFVLNTGYEGLPHIILEAMAMGLPVITTNVCGNPEVVKDSYNGLLVEYNNKKQLKEAILRLWKDNNLRIKFVENAKKTFKRFTLDKMVNETINVLKP